MNRMVLSLFPGIGLLDRAFEAAGFQIVRGPDLIWGGDVRSFHANPDYFCGVIGGPPCQKFSRARNIGPGTKELDLIGEFVRIALEAAPYDEDLAVNGVEFEQSKPFFIVMENVPDATKSRHIPSHWHSTLLRDWDCGGLTARTRRVWTYPFQVAPPEVRRGKPSYSVMATTFKRGGGEFAKAKRFLRGDLPTERYGELQGCKALVKGLEKYGLSRSTIVRLLGNGVPLAMGNYVAQYAKEYCDIMGTR